ncbi:MAG: shikimate dehydrogenase [Deltaproteobacteria bacterium]|nr:shikimate dehydrogenase [Deltaproteobacteria bacterium]
MRINGKTLVHGIMGNPVAHTLSPAMHNRAFETLGLNAVYVPFPVSDAAAAMAGFRALGVRGVSVTIPHKQAVIAHLDDIDPVAAAIGAVNTLVIENGRITGHNTDWIGANRALEEKIPLAAKKILLLGAGGSARAIGFGLLEAGAGIVLASRTPESGRELARTLSCPWLPLSEIGGLTADCLINATSVGMAPHPDASPVPGEYLSRFSVVMDIVYSPLETKLLREAKQAGCQVVNGLAMLLYQGVAQFELWTGQKAPVDIMRESLLAGLSSK